VVNLINVINVVKDLVRMVAYRHTLEHIYCRGDTPNKCNINVCGEGFSQNPLLQIHIRTHTGDKLDKCDVCGERFSENGNCM
jgi:uncharacterized Zn-finger protein